MTVKKPAPLGSLRPGIIDLNDLVELEEEFGSLDTIDWSRMIVMRHLLWLALLHSEPGISLKDVGSRYDFDGLEKAAMEVVTKAGIKGEPGKVTPAPAG